MFEITARHNLQNAHLLTNCPEPCVVLAGNLFVETNKAFRAEFGAIDSWQSCIDEADRDKFSLNIENSLKFVARLACGPRAGTRMCWTAWRIDEKLVCVRLDGLALDGKGTEGDAKPPAVDVELAREMSQARTLLRAVAEMPVTVWAMEPDGTCTLSVGKGLEHFGLKSGQLVGKNLLQVYAANSETHADILRSLKGESISREIRIGEMTWFSTILPVYDALGQNIVQVFGVAENVTERSQAQRRIEDQLALIQSQQSAIAALTSPIIEVWQGVLVVPLIGALDGDRAGRLVEHLLAEVVSRQSRAVILDLTGAQVIDPSTAQNLFDIMRSVRLLGAEGLVSGIRPNVAKTMVELDIAGAQWKTFPTLAEALRRILGKRVSAK